MKAEEVGYRIAQARKKQGMTQRELSERLHVSDKAVSKWERGVNYPDISLFDEIAKTLDLSLVELLGIEDRSKEEIMQSISEISKYEKEKIGKEIYQRGFVTIICGMIVLAGQLSAALIFAQNEVPGAGILCTSGMMCFTGLMIANGLYRSSMQKNFIKTTRSQKQPHSMQQTPETDLHQTMLQGYRRRVQRHRLQGSVLLRQSQEMS